MCDGCFFEFQGCFRVTSNPEIDRENGLSAVIRSEGALDYNRHYINDLPTTSPHGSYFDTIDKICEFWRIRLRPVAQHRHTKLDDEIRIVERPDHRSHHRGCVPHLPFVTVIRAGGSPGYPRFGANGLRTLFKASASTGWIEAAHHDPSATERTPEGLVPLTSFIQNLSEFRFAV
jgi:hypothetical protein